MASYLACPFSGVLRPVIASQHALCLSGQRAGKRRGDPAPELRSRHRRKGSPAANSIGSPGKHLQTGHLSNYRGVVSRLPGAMASRRTSHIQSLALGSSCGCGVPRSRLPLGGPLSALPFAVHAAQGRGTARLLLDLFAMARNLRLASSRGFPRGALVSSLEFHGCWASPGGHAGSTTDGTSRGADTESATVFGSVRRCNQRISVTPCRRGGLRVQPLGLRPAQADARSSVPAELSAQASATRAIHGGAGPVARPRASSSASRFPERHLLGAARDRTE